MKTLNLVNKDTSEIKYEVSKYPDGQQNIVIESLKNGFNRIRLKELPPVYLEGEDVQIKSRLNNWLDLELISCAVASLRELGVGDIHLYVPYIIGARSDRRFEYGGNNYLKDVICPIINSLNFKTVTCIDPHSDVLEACIKGFKKESNEEVCKWALGEIYDYDSNFGNSNMILVSPDAGASKKIYKLAEEIGYNGDIITCSKGRDKDGKLTKCVVPIDDKNLEKDVIIIDDIFDFGGTFKNIAGIMNDAGHIGRKYLIVTHSIQTEGLKDALKWFDTIYTTNSYKDHNIERVVQLNLF